MLVSRVTMSEDGQRQRRWNIAAAAGVFSPSLSTSNCHRRAEWISQPPALFPS